MISGPLAVGDVFRDRLVDNLSRALIAQYAGASGDFNLVHVDEEYAVHEAGRPAVIAHGMLTMGLTATFLTSVVGHGAMRRFRGRFLAVVSAGDSLECVVTVTRVAAGPEGELIELDIRTIRQDGVVVFRGSASARQCAAAPSRCERGELRSARACDHRPAAGSDR